MLAFGIAYAVLEWCSTSAKEQDCVSKGEALIARLHVQAWTQCPSGNLVLPYAEIEELLTERGR